MIAQYNGADRKLAYLFENAREVSFSPILTTGTQIATLTIDDQTYTLYCTTGGGGGSTVSYNSLISSGTALGELTIDGITYTIYSKDSSKVAYSPTQTSGTQIGTLTIDGTPHILYAPNGGGGGGTSDYEQLSNLPKINNNTLIGNKSASDLGLVGAVSGKGLSTNDYTNEDKEKVDALMPNYSTTEQKTGQKWIDGKDIYFKTEVLERTIQINPTSWTTITQGSYMDKLLSVMTVSGDGTVSDGRIRWHLDSGNVQAAAYEILNLVNPTITLYYTKTA